MAFIYHVGFNIGPDQMNELQIGSSLERTVGYLKTLLPSEPGFVAARAMYSLDIEGKTHLIFETVWESWEDIEAHANSSLAEDKVLSEFQPHLRLEHLTVHKYGEVA